MISGRGTGRPWDLFKYAWWGWFWTDDRGIVRGPCTSYVTARAARWAKAEALGVATDFLNAKLQSYLRGQEAHPIPSAEETAPQRVAWHRALLGPPGPEHAATLATPRADKRAKARPKPSGSD